jgi:hypothetical protein
MQKETLVKLASEKNNPCVTISLNTHRTRPDNTKDKLMLKNLCKEAEDRLLQQFRKRDIGSILKELENITEEIDVSRNLESMHIFLSNQTKEIIRSTWPTQQNSVYISDGFVVRPLIKYYNRSEEYLILLVSQSGTRLFAALNDGIVEEIKEAGFPFPENRHFLTNKEKASDAKQVDNMIREYLNGIDKSLVKVINETGMQCVVISTQNNYSLLMQVADKPGVYLGHENINYNDTANHTIAAQAWNIVKTHQKRKKSEAIKEVKEAISQSKVLTDLQEIYKAAKEGRGDLLIIHQDFNQAVKMNDTDTFELLSKPDSNGGTDDIGSIIAWEVISRKGRAVYTEQEALMELGHIALKVRY